MSGGEEELSWDTVEEEGGFDEEMPEDFYAAEELVLGALSKCKKPGGRRKRKKLDEAIENRDG